MLCLREDLKIDHRMTDMEALQKQGIIHFEEFRIDKDQSSILNAK